MVLQDVILNALGMNVLLSEILKQKKRATKMVALIYLKECFLII